MRWLFRTRGQRFTEPPRGSAHRTARWTTTLALTAALLSAVLGTQPGLARTEAWVLRPEVSETLRQALADPAVRDLLPPGWQVESLSVGTRSIEVRLRPPPGGCLVAVLQPRLPGAPELAPVAFRECAAGEPLPGDPTPAAAFASALRDRLGPGDFVSTRPNDRDDASREVPRNPPLALLLASAGLQFLLLVALALGALAALARPAQREAE